MGNSWYAKLFFRNIFILLLFFNCQHPLKGQGQASKISREKIIVGLREEPPFIIKDSDGSYYGLSIDLWHHIADELKVDYEFREHYHLLDIITNLRYGKIDICINPLHVSAPRLKQMDVTQPFFISSLGIAIDNGTEDSPTKMFLNNILSWSFLKLISTLIVIVVLFGTIVWLVEKRTNNEDFRHGMHGILDGIWWSTVTITTVGYGDKTPKTGLGKIISMVWMFAAISLISSFTATITSRLTINNLETNIRYLGDLKKMGKIATVKSSGSEDYLINHNIKPNNSFDTPLEGLLSLAENKVDVFVFDKSVMNYMVEKYQLGQKIKVLPITFNRQYFSFIMPRNSRFFKKINPEIVDKINKDSWQQILKKYSLEDKK